MSRSRRFARPAALALAVALASGGCLSSMIGPTAPPATASPSVAPPTPTPVPTPVPSATFLLYTVVRNDSLLGLADRFHTTGRSIAYWSRDLHPTLDPESADYNPDRLEAGWILRIIPGAEYTVPMGPGDSPDQTPTSMPEPSGSAAPSGSTAG